MKIALCLSGQPRTWKKCYTQWFEMFKPYGELDVFFHFWDYNTLPSTFMSENFNYTVKDEKLDATEINDIVNLLSPKSYLFEPRKPIKYWNCTLPIDKQFGYWAIDQYYSLYYSSLIKKEYEIKHDFVYDAVVKLRSDIWFTQPVILNKPEPNTVYSAGMHWDDEFRAFRKTDIFWYSDSHTFDQYAQYYKFLSFLPTDFVSPIHGPPPEIACYFYLANIGVLHQSILTGFKLMRDGRVAVLRGGKLDDYEII